MLEVVLPIKEAIVDLGITKIKVAVVYGISNVNKMYNMLSQYQFVEVMSCSSGCIGGAGQTILPIQKQQEYIDERRKSLYENDQNLKKRCSYENEDVKKVYKDFLEMPFSNKAKEWLHQKYEDKSETFKVLE